MAASSRLLPAATRKPLASAPSVWVAASWAMTSTGTTKPNRNGSAASAGGQRALPAADLLERNGAIAARRVVAARAAARGALDGEQRRDEHQHDGGELRRAAEVGALHPGGEDAGRQRVDAEVLHGAEIVEAFHDDERDAGRDGRARQRAAPRRRRWRAASVRACAPPPARTPTAARSSRAPSGRRTDRAPPTARRWRRRASALAETNSRRRR